jgi:chaperonin GroES
VSGKLCIKNITKRKKIAVAKKKVKKIIKKKVTKKLTKKPAQKIIKKVAKKTATQKPVKKIVKNAIKKTSKKIVKKIMKKTVKKVLPKTAKQPVKLTQKATPKVNADYSKAVTPLGDRLVVRLTASEKMTAGGLYIPDSATTATGYLKGEVLVVGQGHTTKKGFLRSMDVQKGDQILFSEHAGTKIIFNSEELHIVNESDVLGIIQK